MRFCDKPKASIEVNFTAEVFVGESDDSGRPVLEGVISILQTIEEYWLEAQKPAVIRKLLCEPAPNQ